MTTESNAIAMDIIQKNFIVLSIKTSQGFKLYWNLKPPAIDGYEEPTSNLKFKFYEWIVHQFLIIIKF